MCLGLQPPPSAADGLKTFCAGAKKLAEQGAEVIEGNPASDADLQPAFQGAWGVFAITFVLVATGDLREVEEEEFALGALVFRVSCSPTPRFCLITAGGANSYQELCTNPLFSGGACLALDAQNPALTSVRCGTNTGTDCVGINLSPCTILQKMTSKQIQTGLLCAPTGKLQADAAAAAGVKVFVFSILEDVNTRTEVRAPRQLFWGSA
jgi:hypothetical protein